MKKTFLPVILACAASAGFIGWRVHAVKTQTVNHFALLSDPSVSYTGGCESLVGSTEEVLRKSPVTPDSTLSVLVLGDKETAHEPRRLGRYAIPVSRRVIEGQRASEQRRLDLLKDIGEKCGSVRPTLISPIFQGVKEAVADLRAEGCRENSQCELRVSSDLEENVEVGIKNRIDNRGEGKHRLPAALENNGIKVVFCGFATRAGRIVGPFGRELHRATPRDANREDRLQHTWLSLFTNPELVKFEPYCPKPNTPGLVTMAGGKEKR